MSTSSVISFPGCVPNLVIRRNYTSRMMSQTWSNSRLAKKMIEECPNLLQCPKKAFKAVLTLSAAAELTSKQKNSASASSGFRLQFYADFIILVVF
mmetsp:Transcript_1425/g.1868  ORF Transcript_1425/g.1868 Transcript_1425/m.1868 type:complete len:96 (-) Transcript_1425:13-300(-)